MAADFTSTVEIRKIPPEHMRNGHFCIRFKPFHEEAIPNMRQLTGLDSETLRQLSKRLRKAYKHDNTKEKENVIITLNDAYYEVMKQKEAIRDLIQDNFEKECFIADMDFYGQSYVNAKTQEEKDALLLIATDEYYRKIILKI